MQRFTRAAITSFSLLLGPSIDPGKASEKPDVKEKSSETKLTPDAYELGEISILKKKSPLEHAACTTLIEKGWRIKVSNSTLELTHSNLSLPFKIENTGAATQALLELSTQLRTLEELQKTAASINLNFIRKNERISPWFGSAELQPETFKSTAATGQLFEFLAIAKQHAECHPFFIHVDPSAQGSRLFPIDSRQNPVRVVRALHAAGDLGFSIHTTQYVNGKFNFAIKHKGNIKGTAEVQFNSEKYYEDRNRILSAAVFAHFRNSQIFLNSAEQLEKVVSAAELRGDGVLSLVIHSTLLTREQLSLGFELKIGHALFVRLKRTNSFLTISELSAVTMPVLHTLQRINDTYPGYLQGLADNNQLDDLAKALSEIIGKEYRAKQAGVLLDSESLFIAFCAADNVFTTDSQYRLAAKCGIPNERIFIEKGGDAALNGTEKKTRLTNYLAMAASEPERNVFVYIGGHGSPEVKDDTVGTIKSAKISINKGFGEALDFIEMQEIAQILVEKNNNGKGVVDLSRVKIFSDVCFSHAQEFKYQLLSRITDIALKEKRIILNYPVIVPNCGRGSVGLLFTRDPDRSKMMQALHKSVDGGKICWKPFLDWSATEASIAMDAANKWEIVGVYGQHGLPHFSIKFVDPTFTGGKVTSDKKIFRELKRYKIKAPENPSRKPLHFEWSLNREYLRKIA